MMYWGGWAWFAMTLSMVLFWSAVGVVIWLLVRRPSDSSGVAPITSAEELLRQRFAAGEIDEAEFDQRLAVLRAHRKPGVGVGR